MKNLLRLFLVTLVSWSVLGQAATVPDLYSASVPAAKQAVSPGTRAIEQGMVQVLVKLSGNSAIATLPKIRAILPQAAKYLTSFAYSPEAGSGYRLQLKFYQKALNGLLDKANQAVWGVSRPLTLVWLTQKTPEGTRVVSAGSNPELIAAFKAEAVRRGIPVIFPLYDLREQQAVTAKAVQAFDAKRLGKTLARYGANDLLIGNIQGKGDNQISNWRFVLGADELNFSSGGGSYPALFSSLVDRVADTLASRYAVLGSVGKPDQLMIAVSKVTNLKAYAELLQYLAKLAPVKSVQPVSIDADKVLLTLQIDGGETALQQSLKVGRHLSSSVGAGFPQALLHYSWRP